MTFFHIISVLVITVFFIGFFQLDIHIKDAVVLFQSEDSDVLYNFAFKFWLNKQANKQ